MSNSVLQDSKIIYLYHATEPGTKRVDLKQENAAQELEKYQRAGWSRSRFAQCLYHPRLGQKVAQSPAEVQKLLKSGWLTSPITDPAKAKGAHADAVHPHHNDEHRQVMLEDEKTASK